jgi:50S ribosomal protein L16 3-hydroxylase
MKPDPAPLGQTSVDHFMRRHWQRLPLLVRQAIPGMQPPVATERLFEMAGRDDVESRLVTHQRGRWTLERGPFAQDELPGPRKRDWTLLVQGVDMHDDAAHELLARFRFVPDARLDDLMISWAAPGGGVGPHIDSYDVFLVQAAGRRRWRIAPPGPFRLDERAPLKILADFAPTETWTLEPGDMLYLPPGWAHEGTAVDGPCMTCSVGFRAPSRLELLRAFLADCADDPEGPDPRYADRGSPPAARPGRVPDAMADALAGWLRDWRPSPARIDDFLGRHLTEPKPQVWFESPERTPALPAWWRAAQARGVVLDRRSRIAWRGRRIFLNGESFDSAGASARLRELADARRLAPSALAAFDAGSPLAMRLHAWLAAGWLHLGPTPATARRGRADQSA